VTDRQTDGQEIAYSAPWHVCCRGLIMIIMLVLVGMLIGVNGSVQCLCTARVDDPCDSNPCPVGAAECVSPDDVSYYCTCLPGYRGEHCEIGQ